MTEVQDSASTTLDISALNVLLQELVGDLPTQVSQLLDNELLHNEILHYLHDLSSIGSKDYLSSVPPTPGMDIQEERTLVQDIAELEAAQRSIDTQLKSVIVQSQQVIIDNKKELAHAESLFKSDFNSNLRALLRTFTEDDLEEMSDAPDPDLQELEADLEPSDKDRTFKAIVARVKDMIAQDSGEKENNHLSVVLENMEQILSILELPSLTGACIKAGYYSEALEISSYTRRLAIRFPKSDLVKEVEMGIQSEMSHMLIGLIRLLRTNLKQSSVIKIVSYLRRIQPFSQAKDADEQLKRILLHARFQFIKYELESLTPLKDSELHEKFLKRSIEVIREHCFGSIMAFKNVFPDVNESEMGPVVIEIEEEKYQRKVGTTPEEPATATPDKKPSVGETISFEESKNLTNNEDSEDTHPSDKEEGENHVTADGITTKAETEEAPEAPEKEESPQTAASTTEPKASSNNSDEPPTEHKQPTIQLIRPAEERGLSNVVLFEFVRHILLEFTESITASLPLIAETSVRDGLYLQLIYCSQSLARIDQNFSDLMTSVLLNAKHQGDKLLIARDAWCVAVERQKALAKNLLNRN
ncbi:CYFA0S01e11936g1_1 [Cyberlindnera fabianii]|uniref:Conserved oligomeric Golgi complex subunit 8 n=1 Tax=Cyberlindnera fabianii TaxID=36022 RepID=A0A061AJ40_CYBFA|nr:CYFA0S01e11936g1_1 [Cyberlindnera fabianii]